MALLSNATSFVRYSVFGDVPDNFWDFAAERIRSFAFRDIDDNFEEKSIGWVSVHNMFDSSFTYSSYAAGDFIVLALRIDERKVSAAVLKKFCMKEEERVKKKKELPRLSRGHRQEIKESIKLMLLKKALPTPAVYDLCWNLSDSTLYFFSTNKKAQEILENFFKDTFNLTLTLQIPYLIADHLVDEEGRNTLKDLGAEILI